MKRFSKQFSIFFSTVLMLIMILNYPAHALSVTQSYDSVKTWGGTGTDIAYRVAIDSQNNIYISGQFSATVDFDPGAGVDARTSAGGTDVFLSKYNADGSYAWTKAWGGTGADTAVGAAIDNQDNIYVSGFFNSTVDFDPGAGVDTRTSAGSNDAFLTKYNPDGSYAWTKAWGGTGSDAAYRPAIDRQNNIYVSGSFNSTVDFDPGAGVDERTSAGGTDAFLTKYNADGSYAWAKTWGGTGSDIAFIAAIDSQNSIYAAGQFNSTVDFDPGAGVDSRTSAGGSDAFLSKYSSDGSYAWAKTWGGTGTDAAYGLAIDSQNNLYISGLFNATVDFDPGAGVDARTSAGSTDAFLSKYNTDGSYAWTKAWGGTGSDQFVSSPGIDSNNNIYMYGFFASPTIDLNPNGGDSAALSGANNAFVSALNSEGGYLGGFSFGSTSSTAPQFTQPQFDANDNLYLVGFFDGTGNNFHPFGGSDERTSNGSFDAYLLKISQTLRHHISGLPAGLTLTEISSGDSAKSGDEGVVRDDEALLRLSTAGGIPISDIVVNLNQDLDWNGVTAEVDLENGKSVVVGLDTAEGVISHSLYVPKLDNHQAVGICPQATTLDDVFPGCANVQGFDVSHADVTLSVVNGHTFFHVANVSGTGGFSAENLAATGMSTYIILVTALALFGTGLISFKFAYVNRRLTT